ERSGMKHLLRSERGPDDIIISKRRSVAGVGKEIATKKGLGRLLKNDPRFPVVRNVWRIDVPNLFAAEINDLAVGQLARRSIAQVIERDHTADGTVCDFCAWRGSEEIVHRTAFVGFHVSKGDPAEPFKRNDTGNRLRHERKHASRASVKEKRLVGVDEKLIEREAVRRCLGDAR